jgi:uncharacterized membrane protein
VLLTAFVLIRQNAMDQRSEQRNHLELQINLLAEKEATSILNKLDAIAQMTTTPVATMNISARPAAWEVRLAMSPNSFPVALFARS